MIQFAKINSAVPMVKTTKYRFSETKIQPQVLGIASYMKDIYKTSLLGFGGMVVGGSLLSGAIAPGVGLFGGLILSLGGIIGFQMSQKQYNTVTDINGQTKYVANYTSTQKLCYGSFIGGGMLTLSPLLQQASMINPSILPLSILLTLGTFGGSSLYAMNQPVGKFDSWGPVLYGALLSALVMNLGAAGSLYFMGPNMFAQTVFSIYPYFGIALFSGLQMFDTQQAIASYRAGQLDVLSHSINFILNLKNILINFIQIFSRNDQFQF